MNRLRLLLPCLLSVPWLAAAEVPTVETAVQRGLARVKQAASDWPQHKTCFSCHHQTLPMLSVIESSRVRHELDSKWLQTQAAITHAYFQERTDDMLAGEHVPGGSTTTGYGFWALQLAKHPADATTSAMVSYLLKIQGTTRSKGEPSKTRTRVEQGRWTTSCRRLPMQGSDIADTVLALHGMQHYATTEQQSAVTQARTDAEKWLAQTPPITQEDHIWRLWGLYQDHAEAAQMENVRQAILKLQQADGGWSSAIGFESDAFSTGQTLHILLESGLDHHDAAIQRARDWLLRTQHADGSWLSESRVKNKVQPYFENGDPHGEHQFLSTAATAWAVAGLARLLPPKP